MVRRAAADEIDAGKIGIIRVGQADFAQIDGLFARLILLDARGERIAHGTRLLVDFLHHEMLISVLFGGCGIPLDLDKRLFDFFAVDVVQVKRFAGQAGDFLIIDIDDVAGVIQHGGNVGSDHMPLIFAVAASDDERTVLAGRIQHAGLVAEKNAQRIASANADHHIADGIERTFTRGKPLLPRLDIVAVQQRGGNFCIGLRGKGIPLAHERFFDLLIVFDDTVMDDHHALFTRILRMRVDSAGFAMGCPAGMTDAAKTVNRSAGIGHLHQVFQPPLCLDDLDMIAVFIAHRDTGGIISAVFQLGKPGEQNGCRLFYTCISNNSTHGHPPPDFYGNARHRRQILQGCQALLMWSIFRVISQCVEKEWGYQA